MPLPTSWTLYEYGTEMSGEDLVCSGVINTYTLLYVGELSGVHSWTYEMLDEPRRLIVLGTTCSNNKKLILTSPIGGIDIGIQHITFPYDMIEDGVIYALWNDTTGQQDSFFRIQPHF